MNQALEIRRIIEKRLKVKLSSKDRKQHNADGRAVFYKVMRDIDPNITLVKLGNLTGGRHHTTVINSLENIFRDMNRRNKPFFKAYEDLSKKYGK